jgi:hypothetical protein
MLISPPSLLADIYHVYCIIDLFEPICTLLENRKQQAIILSRHHTVFYGIYSTSNHGKGMELCLRHYK